MSKKYIICGPSRAGKTTLARGLAAKYGCSYIPCDPLVTALQELYPDLGITHNIANDDIHYDEVCKKLTAFLITYIRDGLDEELDAYVIESFHIDIPMLKQAFGSQHTIIVVGYPNVDEAEKFATIKALDKRERSIALPDEERKDDIRRFTHLSKKFQQIAKEQGVMFVDTSVDLENVLQKYIAIL